MYDDTHVREGLQTMTPFNPSGVFYVRDNLAAALMQFRREDEDVNIWCDAICINQTDVKEKTAQVARMHEIVRHCVLPFCTPLESRACKTCLWSCLSISRGSWALDTNRQLLSF
jgi:hypothetical protein